MKRPVFRDSALQQQFEQEGYVKLHLFSPSQIKTLSEYYEPLRQQHEAVIKFRSLYSSVETSSAALLKALDTKVKQTIMPQVSATFQNYQLLISSYLIKATGDDTELAPHQDLTFVQEPDYASFNLWIPLQPTDSSSGQLRVLKGSHTIRHTLRVVPEYPRPFVDYNDTITGLFTEIETEIGDCVIINHAVIHGSSVNLTGQPRLALILGICSADTPIYYHYMPAGGATQIERYQMQPSDFYHFAPDGRPLYAPLVERLSYTFRHTTTAEFRAWIRASPHLSIFQKMKLLYFKLLKNTIE